MTNAFSRDYVPQVNFSGLSRDKKISATRSRQRAEGLASDDPVVREKARGTVGDGILSKRGKKK